MFMFLFYNKEVREDFFVEAKSSAEAIEIANAHLPGSKGYGAFPKSYAELSGLDIIRKGV